MSCHFDRGGRPGLRPAMSALMGAVDDAHAPLEARLRSRGSGPVDCRRLGDAAPGDGESERHCHGYRREVLELARIGIPVTPRGSRTICRHCEWRCLEQIKNSLCRKSDTVSPV